MKFTLISSRLMFVCLKKNNYQNTQYERTDYQINSLRMSKKRFSFHFTYLFMQTRIMQIEDKFNFKSSGRKLDLKILRSDW